MAPRPVWKGYLKLSLVTCAIELSGATTESEKVSFRILNRHTGHTVNRRYIDSVTGKQLERDDEVKGYELADGQFLRIEDEEIDALQIESSHTLSIENFVKKASIEQIYLDTPYYMTPADEVSTEAFQVIRHAMERTGMAGMARIVLYRRERPVVVEPLDNGLLLTTLRYERTVRRPEDILGSVPSVEVDDDMVDLATDIIKRKQATFNPSAFEDRYETALIELIRAKQAGRAAPSHAPPPAPTNVINLFDALRKSLAAERGSAAKPEKRQGEKPAAPASRQPRKRKSA